jgi:hypothetical protein
VGKHLQFSGFDEWRELNAKFALGGAHCFENTERLHEWLECRCVRVGHDVADGDSARRLLEGEVAQVREQERKLLSVVRAPSRFLGALDEDDAKRAGWLT